MFTPDDLDDYYATIRSDPDVMRYLPSGQPQPREYAEQVIQRFIAYWQTHPFGAFAVTLKADGQLIGQCGLQFIPDQTEVELFYALAKWAWGKGFAPEAGRSARLIRFASGAGGSLRRSPARAAAGRDDACVSSPHG